MVSKSSKTHNNFYLTRSSYFESTLFRCDHGYQQQKFRFPESECINLDFK